jgi:hypothetical protein
VSGRGSGNKPFAEARDLLDRVELGHDYWLLLLLVVVSATLQVAAPPGDASELITIFLQAATLATAVFVTGGRRRLVRLGVTISLIAAGAAFAVLLITGDVPRGLAALVNGLLVALAPGVIAAGVVRNLIAFRGVTLRTLSGVLSIYLLIGMFFSFMYGAVQEIGHDQFFAQIADPTRSDFLYFSYITQTTVGYGDLTPAHDLGRMLAAIEALFGQIYLVTVVAVIVGNLGRRAMERPAGGTRTGD